VTGGVSGMELETELEPSRKHFGIVALMQWQT
jgi:hypothetical protein